MSSPDSQLNPDDDDKAGDEDSTISLKEALFEAMKAEIVEDDTLVLDGHADDCIDIKVEAINGINEGDPSVLQVHLEVLIQEEVRKSLIGLGVLRRTQKAEIVIDTPLVVRLVQSLPDNLRQEFVEKLLNPEIDRILYGIEQKKSWEKLPLVREPAAELREELLHGKAAYGSFSGFHAKPIKRKPNDPALPSIPTGEAFDKAMSLVALKIVKRVMRRDREVAADLGDAPLEAISISVHKNKQKQFSLLIQFKNMLSLAEIENLLFLNANETYVIHPDAAADIINRLKKDDEEREAREVIARYVLHILLNIRDPADEDYNFSVADAMAFYESIRTGTLKKYRETSGDIFKINNDDELGEGAKTEAV
jgi:hypothetical protein